MARRKLWVGLEALTPAVTPIAAKAVAGARLMSWLYRTAFGVSCKHCLGSAVCRNCGFGSGMTCWRCLRDWLAASMTRLTGNGSVWMRPALAVPETAWDLTARIARRGWHRWVVERSSQSCARFPACVWFRLFPFFVPRSFPALAQIHKMLDKRNPICLKALYLAQKSVLTQILQFIWR